MLTEALGFFVDGRAGSDDNAGTRAAPFKSIGKALDRVTARRTRINVCASAVYRESLVIDGNRPKGARLQGGLACDGGSWRYNGTPAAITANDPHFALLIRDSDNVTVEDLEISAAPAGVDGAKGAIAQGGGGGLACGPGVAGGSGGCGGCGGGGGPGGTSGGSSFGIIILQSYVAFDGASRVSAGRGGAGALGSPVATAGTNGVAAKVLDLSL